MMKIVIQKLAKVINRSENYRFGRKMVSFFQTLLYLFLLLAPNISRRFQLKQFTIIGVMLAQIIIWFYIIFGVTIMISLLVIVMKGPLKNFTTVFQLSYFLLQASGILYLVAVAAIVQNEQQNYLMALNCIFLPYAAFLVYIQQNIHLFGLKSILSIVFFSILSFEAWNICFFFVIILQFVKGNTFTQKLACFLLGFAAIWTFCFKESTRQQTFSLITLPIVLLLIIFASLYLKDSIVKKDDEKYLIDLITKTQNEGKYQRNLVQLNFKDKRKLFDILMNVMPEESSEDEQEALKDNILDGKIAVQDIFKILDIIIERKQNIWLKVEVQVMKNHNILKTLKLLSEIHPEGLLEKLQLERLKQRTQENNCLILDEKINIDLFQKTISQLNFFYQYSYFSLQALVSFWLTISESFLTENKMISRFQKVIDNHQKAKNFLMRINQIHFCSKQQEIHQQIDKIINKIDEDRFFHSKKYEENFNRQKILTYGQIVLSQGQIQRISPQLLLDLEFQYQNKELLSSTDIFHQKILQMIIENYEAFSQKQFFLPLFQRNKKMLIKRAMIQVMLNSSSKIEYIFIVKPCDPSQMILYDAKENLVVADIIESRGQLQSELIFQEKNISFDKLAIDFRKQHIQNLQKGNRLICEINDEELRVCLIEKQGTLEKISLKLLDTFKNHQYHFLIIEIKTHPQIFLAKFKSKETNRKNIKNVVQKPEKVQFEEGTQKNQRDQVIFCNIKNPLQEYILDKIENHNKSQFFSNSSRISFIVLLLICLIIAMLVSILLLTSQRHYDYLTYLEKGNQLIDEYQQIMSLFQDSYWRTFMKKYPEKVKQWMPQINLDETLNFYFNEITTDIKSIMVEEFENLLQKLKPDLKYTWKHKLYNVSASSRKNDIIECIQEIKRSLVTFDVTFLVDNYQTILFLEQVYRIDTIIISLLNKLSNSPQLLIYVCTGIAFFLTVIIYALLIQSKNIMDSINNYLEKIQHEEKRSIFLEIKEILFKRYPLFMFYDAKNCNKCLKNLDTYLKQGIEKGNLKIKHEKTIFFLLKKITFMLFLGMLIAGGLFHVFQVQTEIEQLNKTIYQLQNYGETSNFIIIKMADSLSSAYWKLLYSSQNLSGESNELIIPGNQMLQSLPQFFSLHRKKHMNLFLSDLCLFHNLTQKIPFLKGVQCSQLLNGVFKKGFKISLESYRSSVAQLKNSSFYNIFQVKRKNVTYPLVVQTEYFRTLAIKLLHDLKDSFVQTCKQYSLMLQTRVKTFVLVIFIICFMIIIVVWISILKINKRSHLSLCLLKTIPRKTLLNIKLTKQMIKTDFLGSLARL